MNTIDIAGINFYLRVSDSASGYYSSSRGKVMDSSPFVSREDAEDVRGAMVNGAEFEVVGWQPNE